MHPPDPENRELTAGQGALLLRLARRTLADHFGLRRAAAEDSRLEAQLADAAFGARRGIFVTLKQNHQLRGCIGSLSAASTIAAGVRENALNAALRDPRFAPLSPEELAEVQIEVSVLTRPVELDYEDADDLLARLRPGIDGVILKKGYASATFLPQVWEQLPEASAFLSHLCTKAGLAADRWRRGDLSVLTYQVQYFEEKI